ncbi:MAG: hypothetical protein M1426_05470 [Patescibacteria group bacterium]|nr:hypothetical protein [Patescibacteria group bacterium]
MNIRKQYIKIWMKFLILIFASSIFFDTVSGKSVDNSRIDSNQNDIIFESNHLKYIIGNDGTNKAFIDKKTGVDYLTKGHSISFMSVEKDGKTYPASSVQYSGGMLRVQFKNSTVAAEVKVESKEKYLTFEIVNLSDKNIDKITMMEIHLSITDSIGSLVSIARNKEFAVCVMGLNMETNTAAGTTSQGIQAVRPAFISSEKGNLSNVENSSILIAYSEASVALTGLKCAVIGVPTPLFLPMVESIEIDYQLPRQTFEGVWGKLSPEVAESYLFIDYTENNIDTVINYAKKGGFTYIMAYSNTWAESDGHYKINLKNFPSGFEGLKSATKKIRDAGLKAGLHILIGGISKNDPYVTPTPDPRLRKDGEYILSEDISSASRTVPLLSSPSKHFIKPRFSGGGIDIQIDDEIMQYHALSEKPLYSFSECERGAYGTKISNHRKGAKVYHLAEIWDMYSVDVKNSLMEEVAEKVAEVVNQCQIRMVYYDGSVYERAQDVPAWYAISKCNYTYFSKWKRDVLVQLGWDASPYVWHFVSRGCSGDWVSIGRKAYVDKFRVGKSFPTYSSNYIPTEFGWWGVFTHTPYCEATYPDELEYVMGKASALNSGFALETDAEVLNKYGRTDELLHIINNYITARKQKYFTPTMRKALLEPGKEFNLEKEPGDTWKLHRINYGPEKIIKLGKDNKNTFSVENGFASQPIRLRLKTMTGLAPYGDPDNIVLEDFSSLKNYTAEKFSRIDNSVKTDVISALTPSAEQTPQGQKSGKFEAYGFRASAKNQWCTQKLYGEKNYNLLNNRILGLWVQGDGSGNLLDVQLFDKGGYVYRSHYVNLNFKGWKYVEFQKPEDTRAYDYQWLYGSYFGGRPFKYENIFDIGFSYLVNNIPQNGKVITYLSGLEAIKEYPAKLINPSFTVNGKTIKFPATIELDNYLEYDGSGKFRIFDTNAQLVLEGIPEGEIPLLNKGKNEITINSEYECKREARAKITIITMGEKIE